MRCYGGYYRMCELTGIYYLIDPFNFNTRRKSSNLYTAVSCRLYEKNNFNKVTEYK